MKKILFVSSEVSPYAKSGGLADVAGSLPKELLKMGYDISVIMPKYREINCEMEYVTDFSIYMQGKKENCIIRKNEQTVGNKRLITFFVDNITYFDRDGMYCHPDEAERYAFFDKAVTEFIRSYNPDIIHLNDWQSGPIALLVREKLKNTTAKIIYTIHNLEYNGRFNHGNLYHFDLDDSYFTIDKFEFYGDISFTKAGIVYSDMITTVSKTYAEEIQTQKYGFGYDGLLRKKHEDGKLIGIVNGIDYEEFNPEKDKTLYKNYSAKNPELKKENKKALQKELKLPKKDVPVLAVISRIVQHKGFDILIEGMNTLLQNEDIQLVVLGMGEIHYVHRLEYLKEKYPKKVSVNNIFDGELAKRIYAGSDMFLMPSLFEPCGLSQLISFRYGTIPIARSTGGLKDTIIGYVGNKESGNGFTFWGSKVDDLVEVTKMALSTYKNKEEWNELVKKVMKEDFSWKTSAKEYAKLYEEITKVK